MEDDRNSLEHYLTAFSYKVHPKEALDESFGPEVLVSEMEPCSHAIFLLGGVHDTFIGQQIDQAIALKKPCLIWIHPRLSAKADANQQTLLNQIRDRQDLPAGSDVLGHQSIPALWSDLKEKLKPAKPKPAVAPASDKPSVYLIFDATLGAESEAATHLSGILHDRNLEVIPYKSYDDHQTLMSTSDAALLLRATTPTSEDVWLRLLADQLILNTRFSSRAMVLADTTRLKLNAGDIPVLTYSHPLSPQALDPFVEKLQRARGAHAGGR